MPISEDFEERLRAILPPTAQHFGTPFFVYDAEGIDHTAEDFLAASTGIRCREYFAVKAQPNPTILRRLAAHGFGFDCSSLPELHLAQQAGARGDDLFFTSNNTTLAELQVALTIGARVTIDDEAVLDTLIASGLVPERLSFRLNPGPLAPSFDQSLFGDPQSAKFGIPSERIVDVCERAARAGVRNFGLHMMIAANSRDTAPILFTLDHLIEQAGRMRAAGLEVDLLNLGGGFGIPYRPGERPLDLTALMTGIRERLATLPWQPTLCFENGRYFTGPHGVLVTAVTNRMSKWREVVGVDASVTSMIRSVIYSGVYHHVTAPLVDSDPEGDVVADIVGSLCTNVDKLAEQRSLPPLQRGDLLVVHDLGAHGHAMASTYNGRLRPQELLLHADGSVELIRRAETEADYVATLDFAPQRLQLEPQSNHQGALSA